MLLHRCLFYMYALGQPAQKYWKRGRFVCILLGNEADHCHGRRWIYFHLRENPFKNCSGIASGFGYSEIVPFVMPCVISGGREIDLSLQPWRWPGNCNRTIRPDSWSTTATESGYWLLVDSLVGWLVVQPGLRHQWEISGTDCPINRKEGRKESGVEETFCFQIHCWNGFTTLVVSEACTAAVDELISQLVGDTGMRHIGLEVANHKVTTHNLLVVITSAICADRWVFTQTMTTIDIVWFH